RHLLAGVSRSGDPRRFPHQGLASRRRPPGRGDEAGPRPGDPGRGAEANMKSRSSSGVFRIGAIAERYGIHPQTLRMYEREGLLRPARTEGNTRLYDADTIERLEIILTLTRHLGVNLAGVEVILHMKQRMEKMQGNVHQLFTVLRDEVEDRRQEPDRRYALTTTSKSLALVRLDKH